MVSLSQHRTLVRHWNASAAMIPGWPKVKLTEPDYPKRFTGPAVQDFPEGLRQDIDARCALLAKRHRTSTGRVARSCAPSTIAMRRRELIAAVRAAVEAGIPLEDLSSLRELLRPDHVEIIIEHYWRKNGDRPTLYTIDLASKLLALARSEPDISEDEIARIDEIRICLEEYRSSGLTEKNRKLIREIGHSDVWREVVQLPPRLMAEARVNCKAMPVKAAVTAQRAVAITILIRAPVRMQNLAAIQIGVNLIRPGGPGTPYMLVFPDYDVKNGVPLEFEFDARTTEIIDEYIHDHRSQLMRGQNHDYLFPGVGNERKSTKTLSEQISKLLWKELGLKITPHQFRHAAAYIMLKPIPAIMNWFGVCSAIAAPPPPGTSTSGWRPSRPIVSSARWSPPSKPYPRKKPMADKVQASRLRDWPTIDREAWERACVPALRLKRGGSAAHMKPSTRASMVRAYGYLLDFCLRNGIVDKNAEPVGHATPAIVDAFVHELHGRVGSVTRAIYIEKIRRMATILAPGRDFSWLGEIESDLRYEARARAKHHRIVPSHRLLRLGLELISRGETGGLTELRRARLVRDGLMIALLSLCPIRLGNFASLRVGQQIRRLDGAWWIVLDSAETKSGRPDERPVPEILTAYIDRWLERWRPLFLEPEEAFWPSTKGGSLAYTYVGHIITQTTLGELGVAINPHLFRDCAVFTVATVAGDRMGIASGLLQHTDSPTIEKHYNKGATIAASRRYQQIILQLMSD